ncbi:MAG: GYD domain-containing protein [SAR202 cluster bacterium]|nr:GYD domain-containing protein [SAR202 cluster bacterium]
MAKSGIKSHGSYCAFGEFDIVTIAEGPDNKSLAAAIIAEAGGGPVSRLRTTVLMSAAEGLEATRGAGRVAYSPPGQPRRETGTYESTFQTRPDWHGPGDDPGARTVADFRSSLG